ncbi:MAG: abortive phage infection protein [Coprothermobacter sp.]|nr:abortive phage infection protein [Coprothermobacter sp.]
MSYADRILQMAHKNNGTVTTAEVTKAGILRGHLKGLVDKGLLEHVERGVYVIPTVLNDEMYGLQTRLRRGIFSHETALFIHDLTDRTPIKFSMTFPLGYNTTSLQKENVTYIRVKKEHFDIGVVWTKSPGGNPIRVYNAERTLCDLLRGRSNTDIQVLADAFRRYTRLKQQDIPLLSEYAKIFRVGKKLQSYLEVLV